MTDALTTLPPVTETFCDYSAPCDRYQLTTGGLVRSPAPTRRGPYKNVKVAPARPRPAFPAGVGRSELLAAIEGLDGPERGSPRPVTPATPVSPAGSLRLRLTESDEEVLPPRRSPRKHQTPTTPRHQQQSGTASTAAQPTPAGATPLRRSPRKQARPLITAGTPTHAENEGPTRLTLTPRRSPRKHQTPQVGTGTADSGGSRQMGGTEGCSASPPPRDEKRTPIRSTVAYVFLLLDLGNSL